MLIWKLLLLCVYLFIHIIFVRVYWERNVLWFQDSDEEEPEEKISQPTPRISKEQKARLLRENWPDVEPLLAKAEGEDIKIINNNLKKKILKEIFIYVYYI